MALDRGSVAVKLEMATSILPDSRKLIRSWVVGTGTRVSFTFSTSSLANSLAMSTSMPTMLFWASRNPHGGKKSKVPTTTSPFLTTAFRVSCI